MRFWTGLTALAVVASLGLAAMEWGTSQIAEASHAASVAARPDRYTYRSPAFTKLVADSFSADKTTDAGTFYSWMDNAYNHATAKFPGKPNLTLEQLLDAKRHYLMSIKDRERRAHNEVALAAWMHKMVKATIPKFSLDRGFEFSNTVRYGERQCFLQSVLIAGMLQRAGIDAGVVMVFRNIAGEESNNGHAATLVRLASGEETIVDASEPAPFATHQGLFVRSGDYRFVTPIYAKYSHRISYYRPAAGGRKIPDSGVRMLDYSFIRSQFYYYRGERAVGGILANNHTPSGLKDSERNLQRSVEICPENPLAVYMLGRVYLLEGRQTLAKTTIHQAAALYDRFGWLPSGPKEYLALVDRSDTSSAEQH